MCDDAPRVKNWSRGASPAVFRARLGWIRPPPPPLRTDGDRLGRGNSHEVLLYRNPSAKPRTLDRVLPEGDGNEGDAAGADAAWRGVGRAEESRLRTETGAQPVSGREQGFSPLSQRRGTGSTRVSCLPRPVALPAKPRRRRA